MTDSKVEIFTVDSKTQNRKQSAAEFLQLIMAGRIDEAYKKYVDMQGKHHNPFFPAGFPGLKKEMIENHAQFPSKQLAVKNVLGDGDLVAVHSHIVLRSGESGIAAVHLFRFQGERIVEMWDFSQLSLRICRRGWHVLALFEGETPLTAPGRHSCNDGRTGFDVDVSGHEAGNMEIGRKYG